MAAAARWPWASRWAGSLMYVLVRIIVAIDACLCRLQRTAHVRAEAHSNATPACLPMQFRGQKNCEVALNPYALIVFSGQTSDVFRTKMPAC